MKPSRIGRDTRLNSFNRRRGAAVEHVADGFKRSVRKTFGVRLNRAMEL